MDKGQVILESGGKREEDLPQRHGGHGEGEEEVNHGDTGNPGEEFSGVPVDDFLWEMVSITRSPEPAERMYLPCFKGLALKPEIVATYESNDISYMNVRVGVTHVRSGMALGSFSFIGSAMLFLSALSQLPVDWCTAGVDDIRSDAWKETREQVLAIRRKLEVREMKLTMESHS